MLRICSVLPLNEPFVNLVFVLGNFVFGDLAVNLVFVVGNFVFVIETLSSEKCGSKVLQNTNDFTSDGVNGRHTAQDRLKLWLCQFIHIYLCPFLIENTSSSEPG